MENWQGRSKGNLLISRNIDNDFNGFIDHIQIGTGNFVEFHDNFLDLQMLRSCEQVDALTADIRLDRKGPSSNSIVVYQILAPFLP